VAEAPVTLPPPLYTENETLKPDMGLLLASVTRTPGGMVTAVPTVADCPLPALAAILAAVPATLVIAGDVPVLVDGLVLVAVTVYETPAVVLVVRVTAAMPLLLVVDVVVLREPLVPVFVQATLRPAVATALPYWSASWADTVTPAPATGLVAEAATRYFVAAPASPVAVKVELEPMPTAVALRVLAPALVPRVQLPTVAIPELFVVATAPVTEPPPPVTEKVTSRPLTGLLLASVTSTRGAVVTAVPTVADWPVPALAVILLGVPEIVVMVGEVPVRVVGVVLVAVTVTVDPVVVPVVMEMVALPPVSVVAGLAVVKLPAPVFVKVTARPGVATALPYASVSCAVMVTELPAAGW